MEWIILFFLIHIAGCVQPEKCQRNSTLKIALVVPTANSDHCTNLTGNTYLCGFEPYMEVTLTDLSRANGVEIQGAHRVIMDNSKLPSVLNLTDICNVDTNVKANGVSLNLRNCSSGTVKRSFRTLHIANTHLQSINVRKVREIDIIEKSHIDLISGSLTLSRSTFQDSYIQEIEYLNFGKESSLSMKNMFIGVTRRIEFETMHKVKLANVTMENVIQPSFELNSVEITRSNIASNATRCPILKAKTHIISETYICKRLVHLEYMSEDGLYRCSDRESLSAKQKIPFLVTTCVLAGLIVTSLLLYLIWKMCKRRKKKSGNVQERDMKLKNIRTRNTIIRKKSISEQKPDRPHNQHAKTPVNSRNYVQQPDKVNDIEDIIYSGPTEIQSNTNITSELEEIYG